MKHSCKTPFELNERKKVQKLKPIKIRLNFKRGKLFEFEIKHLDVHPKIATFLTNQ
jgi:hypothetical protein